MTALTIETAWTAREELAAKEIAPGLAVVPRFTVTASGGELPFAVQLDVELDSESRQYRVVGIRGSNLTSDGLRKIPISRILRASSESVLRSWTLAEGSVRSEPLLFKPAPRALGGPSVETLYWVMIAYRSAVLFGQDPTGMVAERLAVPRSTAGRWVRLARNAGFLGEALPAKGGEGR